MKTLEPFEFEIALRPFRIGMHEGNSTNFEVPPAWAEALELNPWGMIRWLDGVVEVSMKSKGLAAPTPPLVLHYGGTQAELRHLRRSFEDESSIFGVKLSTTEDIQTMHVIITPPQ